MSAGNTSIFGNFPGSHKKIQKQTEAGDDETKRDDRQPRAHPCQKCPLRREENARVRHFLRITLSPSQVFRRGIYSRPLQSNTDQPGVTSQRVTSPSNQLGDPLLCTYCLRRTRYYNIVIFCPISLASSRCAGEQISFRQSLKKAESGKLSPLS